MFTYQINIEYLGTNFVGWQFQKNGVSVQEVLEKALSKFLKDKIKVIGSGRTDAGVHAKEQSAHFKTIRKINDRDNFINSMNFFLQKYPVSILNIRKRSKIFHARHSAKKREYEYVIINRLAKPVIDFNRGWLINKNLDIREMKKAIKYFIGTHDFSAFRSSSCTAASPIRTIKSANIIKKGDKIFIKFISKSFLQKQVRSMVGCLKYVGERKWNSSKIKKIIKSKRRSSCAPPAPAEGLFLKKVFY